MSDNFIIHAFVAGEVSPKLLGRTDLEKYDLGLAQCKNFFVDYRGGITSRAGTEFTDYVKNDDKPTKFIPFRFSTDTEDTYVILFTSGEIRFIQNGAYVLEADVAITDITQTNPATVTAAGHGFVTGDWVKLSGVGGMTRLNGQTFRVGSTTANTFNLHKPHAGTGGYSTIGFPAYTSGGVAARIYTITHPYGDGHLADLQAYQIRDTVRLTHKGWATRNLTRAGHTNWTLTFENFNPSIDFPTGVAAVASGAGSAEALFVVTAVDENGEESQASDVLLKTGMVDYTTTAGSVKISWDLVSGAVSYNVYRSRVVASPINKGEQIGYIGTVTGGSMVDNNIIPDFVKTPPQFRNPFRDGVITFIEVTAGGTGYATGDTVSVSGGSGSGFRGTLIVDPGTGEVIGVDIVNGGTGYTSPSATITTSTGSGATLSVTASSGATFTRFPRTSTLFQQRQIYAASAETPLGVWGSRPGYFSNFDVSRVLTDGDAYEFEIDSPTVTAILHMVSNRLGLLLLTGAGIWLVSGGEEKAVTPLNAIADPQTSNGAASIPPIIMDTDLLYLEAHGRTARLLGYDELQKAFKGKDISILANHLFDAENQITHWAHAKSPHGLIWARRADGALLCLTIDQEQNVFAWAPQETRGLVEDVVVVEEDNEDAVYLMVKRKVNGRWTKFIERMASRIFDDVENAWCVDCGTRTALPVLAGTLEVSAASGTGVTFTSASGSFTSSMIGRIIRVGGGKATITTFNSANEVLADITQTITKVIPGTSIPLIAEQGEWTVTATFSSVSRLDHLEGETVKVLLDGQPIADKVVSGGAISLGTTGSRAVVGLGFTATAQTLPPTSTSIVIEGRVKDIVGTAVRIHDTKGLKVGASLDKLYELKGALSTGAVVRGMEHALVAAAWDVNGQTYYVQDYPLPATILGIVLDMEIGDDTA